MAVKKKASPLELDLANADYMTILAGGGTSNVFKKNDMIDYSYPTGVSVIDYSTGYEVNVKDDAGNLVMKRRCLGLQAGSFNVITGATQSFKTTIGMQICANIAYANGGNVYHLDAENRLVVQRVKTITHLPDDWFTGDYPRYQLRSGAIGYDTLQNDITEIYQSKMLHKDLLLKDTGAVDDQNRPIWLMPPTIVFLDSVSDVIAKQYNVNDKNFLADMGELRNNVDGMRNAKTLRGVLTDINPMMKEANIILIAIAHKNSNASMNAFAPPSKQFQYGRHDEKISGGKALEYGCSLLMNLTAEIKEDSRYHLETDGFEGNTVLFEPTKASTNESGNEKTGLGFRIVVDKRKNGVDNLRTLVLFLNQRGRLKGNKAGYRVIDKTGEPLTEKFTWKNIYEDFKANRLAYKDFMIVAKQELETLIAEAPDVAGQIDPFNIDKIIDEL